MRYRASDPLSLDPACFLPRLAPDRCATPNMRRAPVRSERSQGVLSAVTDFRSQFEGSFHEAGNAA
mgnify:CR=1 FL=1